MPAWSRTRRTASIGPTPMISGSMPETDRGDDARLRRDAELLRPRVAHDDDGGPPSFSGHALPAVTLPSGRNTGLELREPLERRPARGPSSLETTVPSSFVYGVISRCEVAGLLSRDRALLRALGEAVHLLALDAEALGDVLGGQAHRDVDVADRVVGAGQAGDGAPRRPSDSR